MDGDTDLKGEFCKKALRWETDSIARWYLIRAIGILKIKAAIPHLIKICLEPEVKFKGSSLHLITAWSLGKIGENAIDLLLSALKHCKVAENQKCLVDALGEIRNPRAIDALKMAFENMDQQVKLWAALSLSKIGKASLDVLYNMFFNTRKIKERIVILDAIDKIGDCGSREFLKKILLEGSEQEVYYILTKCTRLFDQSFYEPLLLITKRQDIENRKLAKRMLKGLPFGSDSL